VSQSGQLFQFIYDSDGFVAEELIKIGGKSTFVDVRGICDRINYKEGWTLTRAEEREIELPTRETVNELVRFPIDKSSLEIRQEDLAFRAYTNARGEPVKGNYIRKERTPWF